MEHYKSQYEGTHHQKDEYGNPVHRPGETGDAYGTGGYGATGMAGHGGIPTEHQGHGQGHEQLRRSGSSSSSSSEDDGEGGRRKKKGLKEKIKEKLPGGEKTQQSHGMSTTPPGETGGEKKGMMEKIKEKLPGGHHSE